MSEGMRKLVGLAIFGALIVAGIVGSDASDDSAVTRNAAIPILDGKEEPSKDGEVESEKGGDCCDETLAILGELITKVDALAQQQDTLAQQVAGLNVNQGSGGPTQEEAEQILRDSNCNDQRFAYWICVDSQGAELPLGVNLSGVNLAGAAFLALDLTGADFSGANLAGADFSSDLTGADFTNANLGGAEFTSSILMGADFTGANLAGTDFTNSRTEGAIGLP
jgi:uncharacterized protein YjbI with pentapeptide repeats